MIQACSSKHADVCLCVTSWRMVCHKVKARGVFRMQMTSQATQSLHLTQLSATL